MLKLLTAVALLAGLTTAALADDIVTMPTANQLKAGEVDVAGYYLGLDLPKGAPQSALYQTLYLGLTNRFELDLHHADVSGDKSSIVSVLSYKVISENATQPDLVLGVRNLTGETTTNNPLIKHRSRDRSFYVAGAKTFFLRSGVQGPPLVRVHMALGTADWTLLGEKRHEGAFGGLQFLFTPILGAVTEHDGTNWITGLTLMPKNSGLTLKGGTFSKHTWVGLAYRRQM